MRAEFMGLGLAEDGAPTATFKLRTPPQDAQLNDWTGQELKLEVSRWRNRRSKDANAYLWVLIGKIAEALHADKDEIYLQLLEHYGVFTHLVVKPQAAERVKAEWRTVRELGEVTINGKKGIQLQCYFGSSTYNTKEMSALLDGVIQECASLGIPTETPEEIALMKARWGT